MPPAGIHIPRTVSSAGNTVVYVQAAGAAWKEGEDYVVLEKESGNKAAENHSR